MKKVFRFVFYPLLQQTHSDMIWNINWTCRRCACTWWRCLTFAVESIEKEKKIVLHITRKSEKSSSIFSFHFFFHVLKTIRIRTNSIDAGMLHDSHAVVVALQRKTINQIYRRTRVMMFYTRKTWINSRKLNRLYYVRFWCFRVKD